MWHETGKTLDSAVRDVQLHEVESDSGEGTAYEVRVRGQLLGRVQQYTATIELGRRRVSHGMTWAYTPLVESARYGTSTGRTTFGFATRDDATRYGVR